MPSSFGVPIFCDQCNKGFDFNNLPPNRPIFCPDCGSSAIRIDTAELLQRMKSVSRIEDRVESKAADNVDTLRTKKVIPSPPPDYSHYPKKFSSRKALVLSSFGGIIGILGIGHLYIKQKSKGIGFLIVGLIFYFIVLSYVNYIFWNRPLTGFNPDTYVGIVFFSIIYFLIWLWQFIDLKRIVRRLG
jgi:hypothetical protein